MAVLAFLAVVPTAPPATTAPAGPQEAGVARFVDVTAGAGIDFRNVYGGPDKAWPTEFGGSGAAWVDVDVDGRADLFLVNAVAEGAADPAAAGGEGPGHALFRNLGGRFADATGAAGVGDVTWGNGVAVGDVDNDGFPDLYVTAIGANRLYRNNGDGTFSPWPSGAEDTGWGTSAAFLDWDGDGWLDLYVVNYVDFDADATATLGDGVCFYRGIEVFCGPEGLTGARDVLLRNVDGTGFEPWHPVDAEGTYGFALVATDCDGDLHPEVYVATDSTINLLYGLPGGATVEDVSLFSGAGYSGAGQEQAGMGATAGDFDGDGDMDLFVTNFQNDYNTLYRNVGGCVFEDVSEQLGLGLSSLPYMGWAALFLDADADADLDLFVANGHIYPQLDAAGLEAYKQDDLFYRNALRETGEAVFVEESAAAFGDLAPRSSRGAVPADFDGDGDLDLLVTHIEGPPRLLRQDGARVHPTLALRLVGRAGPRDAHGARVTVVSGGVEQVREVRTSDGYAGAGDASVLVALPGGRADAVAIAWPGGGVTRLRDVEPGRAVVVEGQGVAARAPW